MELWIIATIAAAFFQTLRFAVQKQLTTPRAGRPGLSAVGATWARFLYSAPLLAFGLGLWLTLNGHALPELSGVFWLYAIVGGVGQILATVCVVMLFSYRAFAVGLTFKKSEVLQTALIGWIILGDTVGLAALAALVVGFVALTVLSKPPQDAPTGAALRAVGLGMASGLFFAVAGVCYRGATLEIDAPTGLQAAVALSIVTALQTAIMAVWLVLRDRPQAMATLRVWRPGLLLGLCSLAGSMGWFIAFAQQNAAFVFALGQVELLFGLILGRVMFAERPSARELAGMGLLVGSMIWLVLVI